MTKKGAHEKPIYRGDCLKGGTVCRFRGGGAWQERGGGVFEGGLIPQCPT